MGNRLPNTKLKCGECGELKYPQGMKGHYKYQHPDVEFPGVAALEALQIADGLGPKPKPSNGSHAATQQPQGRAAPTTAKTRQVNVTIPEFVPSVRCLYTIETAMQITEAEWGWPEMEPSTWLMNYILNTMKGYGYHLRAYVREPDAWTPRNGQGVMVAGYQAVQEEDDGDAEEQ